VNWNGCKKRRSVIAGTTRDTNILLRSAQPTHPLCAQATQAVSKLIRQKDAVFFCSQNIAEFWNVATRSADLNGWVIA
jgi:hypothetical protein